jgi:hypothetical protein
MLYEGAWYALIPLIVAFIPLIQEVVNEDEEKKSE